MVYDRRFTDKTDTFHELLIRNNIYIFPPCHYFMYTFFPHA